MKNIPQRTLQYNIELVKYENPDPKDTFDMTTIHSLLIDQNPKFIELCQLIFDYNSKEVKKELKRPHLQRPFVKQLYKMLSELTRIYHRENQLNFLNKVYAWAFQQRQEADDNLNSENQKIRPNTASTKSRPYSAYTKNTRPDSGVSKKNSVSIKKTLQSETISKDIVEKFPNVDFKDLKYGEKDFFLGHRTMHPEYERPKVRLKQYQRNRFYEDPDDEQKKFQQFFQEKKPKKKQILQEIPLQQEPPIEENNNNQLEQNAGEEALQGQQGAPGVEDVNIDDLVGGEQQQDGEGAQQEVEVVDKLKPRIKAYGDQPDGIPRSELRNYYQGLQANFKQKNNKIIEVEEDQKFTQMMQMWATNKNRMKVQARRRAQSARMVTKYTGQVFEKYTKKEQKKENQKGVQVIDLTNPHNLKMVQVKAKTRPVSSIPGKSERVYNETIQAAIMTGNIKNHINLNLMNPVVGQPDFSQKMGTFAAKPKKKTFEEILRQAEQKVNKQTVDEIEKVKQSLVQNKIPLGVNKIYASLSHHQPQVIDGQFAGIITGQGMLKNPFIKVAKKKKKKKKK